MVKKIIIIGDHHGKDDAYNALVNKIREENKDIEVLTVCLGDSGIGFVHQWKHRVFAPPTKQDFMLMGNHDNRQFAMVNNLSFCITKPTISREGNTSIFFVPGASSPHFDAKQRTELVDWFPWEELSFTESETAYQMYKDYRPEIVISHDAPYDFLKINVRKDLTHPSFTQDLLQAMFQQHRPKLWIFGHWHKNTDQQFGGTRFICLPELETFEINLD